MCVSAGREEGGRGGGGGGTDGSAQPKTRTPQRCGEKDTKQVKRASYRAVVLRRNTHSAMFVHSRCLQANQHV